MLKTQTTAPQTVVSCHLQSHHALKERIMQLHQRTPSSIKKTIGGALLCTLLGSGSYAAWAYSPKVLHEPISARDALKSEQANTNKKFQVKTTIVVDGVKATPRTISYEGEAASIAIDGDAAKWGVSYIVTSAKTKDNPDAVMLDVTVTRNGEAFSHPRILTTINVPASIKHTSETRIFEITLEPSIVM
jgi:nitric oxide reductase large subunit